MLNSHFILHNGKTKPYHFQIILTLNSVSVMEHLGLYLGKCLQNELTKAIFILKYRNGKKANYYEIPMLSDFSTPTDTAIVKLW